MSEVATAARPRGALALLADRSFGSFFVARLLTSIGVWLHTVVAAIAVFEATGSAATVGVVSAVQFAPQLILAPASGRWADQYDIRRQMNAGRLLSAIGSLALAGWFAIGRDLAPAGVTAAAVITASLIVGVGLVIGGPAMQTAVPLLVQRQELPAAMALNTAPITVGRIVGPAVGALMTVGLGFAPAFAVAGVVHLAFIALITPISFPRPARSATDTSYSIREALRFVRHDRPVMLILIAVTAVGIGSEPTVTLAPPLAAELHGSTDVVGALTAAMGIGAAASAVLMSALASRVRQDLAGQVGIVTMAGGLLVCSFSGLPVWAALIAFGVVGVGFIVALTSLSTLMQMRVPPLLRGRVMALWLMGFVGARPVGALVIGGLADLGSVHLAFAAVTVLLLACALACRPRSLNG